MLQVYPLQGFWRVSRACSRIEKSSPRNQSQPSEDSYRLPEHYQQMQDQNDHSHCQQNQIDNLTFSHGYAPFIACTPQMSESSSRLLDRSKQGRHKILVKRSFTVFNTDSDTLRSIELSPQLSLGALFFTGLDKGARSASKDTLPCCLQQIARARQSVQITWRYGQNTTRIVAR